MDPTNAPDSYLWRTMFGCRLSRRSPEVHSGDQRLVQMPQQIVALIKEAAREMPDTALFSNILTAFNSGQRQPLGHY